MGLLSDWPNREALPPVAETSEMIQNWIQILEMSDWPLTIPPAVETEFKFRIQIFKKSDWANREVLGMMENS